MTLPTNAAQVLNQTHNAPSQPGVDYFLNGGLYAFDAQGIPTIVAGDPFPAGMIGLTATNAVPVGWLACNGNEYSQKDFKPLYAAIGTVFGSSDVTKFFKVPNISNLATGVSYIIKT